MKTILASTTGLLRLLSLTLTDRHVHIGKKLHYPLKTLIWLIKSSLGI